MISLNTCGVPVDVGRVLNNKALTGTDVSCIYALNRQVDRNMKTANKPLISIQFDFKEWAELARQDPDRFESRRSRIINEAIRRVPSDKQEMLHRLQWKVDRVRELKRTPLAACMAISHLMWESFNDLHTSYVNLAQLKAGQNIPPVNLPKAKVIPFPSCKIRP